MKLYEYPKSLLLFVIDKIRQTTTMVRQTSTTFDNHPPNHPPTHGHDPFSGGYFIKKSKLFFILFLTLALVLSSATVVSATGSANAASSASSTDVANLPAAGKSLSQDNPSQASGEVIIQYHPSATPMDRAFLRSQNALRIKKSLKLANTELLTIRDGQSVDAVVTKLKKTRGSPLPSPISFTIRPQTHCQMMSFSLWNGAFTIPAS